MPNCFCDAKLRQGEILFKNIVIWYILTFCVFRVVQAQQRLWRQSEQRKLFGMTWQIFFCLEGFYHLMPWVQTERRAAKVFSFNVMITLRVGCQPNHLTVTMRCNRYVIFIGPALLRGSILEWALMVFPKNISLTKEPQEPSLVKISH